MTSMSMYYLSDPKEKELEHTVKVRGMWRGDDKKNGHGQ
jgi:hypothetical protein